MKTTLIACDGVPRTIDTSRHSCECMCDFCAAAGTGQFAHRWPAWKCWVYAIARTMKSLFLRRILGLVLKGSEKKRSSCKNFRSTKKAKLLSSLEDRKKPEEYKP